MLGQRQMGFDEYIEIFRRSWWIVVIPAVVLGVGAFLVTLTMSNQFTSTTLVLVDQQRVPEDYVKSVVTEDIAERLGTMQEQIFSRTRLEPIIEKFDLYKRDRSNSSMEDLVSRFRKTITVTPVKSITSQSGSVPGFTIAVDAGDPRLAQQLCSEITSMFIQEDLNQLEQTAQGTTNFLKQQLDDAKRQLDAQDSKLADFQRKFMGSLPGDEQADMNMISSVSSQLDAVTSQLYRAQQDEAYQQSMLAQHLSSAEPVESAGQPAPGVLQQQLADLQAKLLAMQAQYTPDYPDVVNLKKDIESLKQKIASEAAQAKPKTPAAVAEDKPVRESPAIQQLRALIHQNEVLIAEKSREQNQLRTQLGALQARVSMSPGVEQEYKQITRDHDTALKFYNTLLSEENQAQMATSLEAQQQGEQFRIMDPANLPEKPSFPNRPAFAAGGFGVGLILGIGIVLLLEYRDKSLRTESDVELFLGLPTLAMVPLVQNGHGDGAGKSRNSKRKVQRIEKQSVSV